VVVLIDGLSVEDWFEAASVGEATEWLVPELNLKAEM